MLSFRQKFIGIQLLLIFQYTTALVLLTANFEDVKKIARKFFSEPIAEQIATFIAKANGLAPDVSEENDENASNVQDISTNELETSKKQQSTSKRYKTWPRQTTEREPAYVNQESSESLKQMQKYQIKVTKKHEDKTKSIYRPNPKPEMEQTSRYSDKQKGTSNSKHSNSYWNKKPQQPPKQYIWEKLEPVKKLDYSEDSSEHQSPKLLKGTHNRSKSKYAAINHESGSIGQHKDDRKRKGPKADSVEIQFKHQPFQLRSHDSDTLFSNDDKEHKESKKKHLEIEFTVVNANTNIRTRNRNEFTTEKEKIDFDQYDIGKKHTLVIATSGPVELKRRNTGWREKEMSKATAEEERKPWL